MTSEGCRSYALYRYFDEASRLLYVGVSGDLMVRHRAHIARSRWMQLTASSTVERHCGDWEEVLEVEREAIKAGCPIFNKNHNNTPEAAERMRAYLQEIGRMDLLSPPPRPLKVVPAPQVDPEVQSATPPIGEDEPHRENDRRTLCLSVHVVNPDGSTSVLWRSERDARRLVELCQERGLRVTLGDEEPWWGNPYA